MSCEAIVGVKNIKLTLEHCESGQRIANLIHLLATDELPKWRMFDRVYDELPGGYVKMKQSNYKVEMKIIRDLRIPLAWYQGAARIDVTIEYQNGLVYVGSVGGVRNEESSDTHEVTLMVVFRRATELLPPGALVSGGTAAAA